MGMMLLERMRNRYFSVGVPDAPTPDRWSHRSGTISYPVSGYSPAAFRHRYPGSDTVSSMPGTFSLQWMMTGLS